MSEGERMQDVKELKKSRAGIKSKITRFCNSIDELMVLEVEGNVEAVKAKVAAVVTGLAEIKSVNDIIRSQLHDEYEIEEADLYFAAVEGSAKEVLDKATTWMNNVESSDNIDGVNPGDSASQVGSGMSSTETSEIALKAEARKAALEVEEQILRERQTLEMEELSLKQRRETLEMKARINAAEAERAVFRAKTTPRTRSQLSQLSQQNRSSEIGITTPNKGQSEISFKIPVRHDKSRETTDTAILRALEDGQQGQKRLLEALHLPRAELMTYDGDPIQFWVFLRSFQNNVDNSMLDDNAKLTRLLQYCTGNARQVIQCCSVMDPAEGYKRALQLLKERFGDNHVIADAWLQKVIQGAPISSNDKQSLRAFADDLKSCGETLKAMGFEGEINTQSNLVSIVERLPGYLRNRWVRRVSDIRKNKIKSPGIDDLISFVDDVTKEVTDPVYGKLTLAGRDNKYTKRPGKGQEGPHTSGRYPSKAAYSTTADNKGAKPQLCSMCEGDHSLFSCTDFKAKTPSDRLKFARELKLCFNCLKPGHFSGNCPLYRTCTIEGCGRKHTKFLHITRPPRVSNAPENESSPDVNSGSSSTNVTCSVTGAGVSRTALPVVPVEVTSPDKQKVVITYALLDTGSTSTFCTNSLASQLGLQGQKTRIELNTLDCKNASTGTSIVSLNLKAIDGGATIALTSVYTREQLNIDCSNIATQADADKWPHLADLTIPEVNINDISILIGQDCPDALMPLDIRKGPKGSPFAVKTRLGWVINGPMGNSTRRLVSVNFVEVDKALERQMERFWKIDTCEGAHDDQKGYSVNDKRALKIWGDSIRLKEGHYEISIPFKHERPHFPSNRHMAEHRLDLLKRRLMKNPDMLTQYGDSMRDLIEQGHAERVDGELKDSSDRVEWYLPHHPVFHPRKPDKLRIVFDCAAVHRGTSLNDRVLQGPDLTNKLIGVLLRFRKESVALMADIRAMFHQVKVPLRERDALRFLWWPDGNLACTPDVYRMTVHLFGGTWSPSCCSFALRHTAMENKNLFDSKTVETVLNDFYVDDCLTSVDTEEKAITMAKELREILAKGGFCLTKWLSNVPRVVESVPTEHRAHEVKGLDFNFEAMPTERALGVFWDVEEDCFGFRISPKEKPLTKRGVLSIVSSTYDPQGFVSPFVLKAKLLLQEMSRRKQGWDDTIPSDLLDEWQRWKKEWLKLEHFKVNRCLKPRDFGKVLEYQLHHFADASQVAYGSITFLRMTNSQGEVHVSLVMAKSRLAPIKTMTIPRLELSAATLSVKMDAMIRRELSLSLVDSVFWTDSTLVLQYVRNVDKRFHTFVANRISVIREGSEPSQWRDVDTKRNPADDVSRGLSADDLLESARWLHGPEFLCSDEGHWPDDPVFKDIAHDDPEIKVPKATVQSCVINVEVELNSLFEKHSSWYSLKRSVACLLRVKRWLRSKVKGHALPDITCRLSVKEVSLAEEAICAYVQDRSFHAEIAELRKAESESAGEGKARIKRTSPLYKLCPILKDGLVRVGGRLSNSPIPDKTRFPIVLPKNHRVVELIVTESHNRSGHSGREHVLSLLMQKFWIIGARLAIRKAARDCTHCRRLLTTPSDQKMSDLPADRVTPGKPPFTHVGVDYFGPFLVKRGRSRVKRYGCLFTCLSIRAIHIEIAYSLDTDSFINALQRFMCRRGQPELIRSDNGTNFVGAEREIRQTLQNWNQGAIHEFLLQKEIRWLFNPPSASHMGGAWERQIRTVRKLMKSLCREQVMDDEALCTLMCHVESIVNGRPITVVSRDPRDNEPLTPNHLLLLRGSPVVPYDNIDKKDNYSKRRWRQVQYLASVFWRRWTREYLPTLQRRQKWIEPLRNISVGDIVVVVDENLPRNVWVLGKILEVYYGRDNLVRSAKVKTKTTTLVRPVKKLCLLEAVERTENNNSD